MKPATFSMWLLASALSLATLPANAQDHFAEDLDIASNGYWSEFTPFGDNWWFRNNPYSPYGYMTTNSEVSHNLSKVGDSVWLQSSYGYSYSMNSWVPFYRYMQEVERTDLGNNAFAVTLRDVYNPSLEYELHVTWDGNSWITIQYFLLIYFDGQMQGGIMGENGYLG